MDWVNQRNQLYQLLIKQFSLDELIALAFELGLDHETFPHDTKPPLCRELILYHERRDQLRTFVEAIHKHHPTPLFPDLLADLPREEQSSHPESPLAPFSYGSFDGPVPDTVITRLSDLPLWTDYHNRVLNFLDDYLSRGQHLVPFGGRSQELRALDQWLATEDAPPYTLLTAEAGYGKSALLVQWARWLEGWEDTHVVFIPVSHRFNLASEAIVFTSLAAKLAKVHSRSLPSQKQTADEWRKDCLDYLHLIPADGKNLVVILDGLNEAEAWEVRADLFPRKPPKSLRVIVSARVPIGDSGEGAWRRRLGWEAKSLAQRMSLSRLTSDGVKAVLHTLDGPRAGLADREEIVAEFYRLTEGHPVRVQEFVQALPSDESQLERLQPTDLQFLLPTPQGHPKGYMWLGVGSLAVVSFLALGTLLLSELPWLALAVAVMGVALVLGWLLIDRQRAQPFVRQVSAWIEERTLAQRGFATLAIVSLLLWGGVGVPRLQAIRCRPLPCGLQRFAVAEGWENLTSEEAVAWTDATRDALISKLEVAGLEAIAEHSPQVTAEVRQQLDLWIEGSYQNDGVVRLSVELYGRGASRKGPPVEVIQENNEGPLQLQQRLAEEVLTALGVTLSPATLDQMRQVPTVSQEAADLNYIAGLMYHSDESSCRFQEAQPLLTRAMALDPNYAHPHNNLGMFLAYCQNDPDSAVAEFQKAIRLRPEVAWYHFNLGLAYEKSGNYSEAIASYKQAIKFDSAYVPAFNNLGFTYLVAGRLEEAEQALRNGLEIDPRYPYLHKNLGRTYLEQGRVEQAITELQLANELYRRGTESGYGEALYYLAQAHLKVGQTEEACAALRASETTSEASELERATEVAALVAELGCQD